MCEGTIYLVPLGDAANEAFANCLDEALITEIVLHRGAEPARVWEASKYWLSYLAHSSVGESGQFSAYCKMPDQRYPFHINLRSVMSDLKLQGA